MSEAANKMEQAITKRKYRLILDFKSQFPEKLYDIANDGYLIHWNRDDTVSMKDEEEFEKNVMTLYPGFLQIPTVLNLKRLFREYAFDRDIGPNGVLKFSHPCFQRGRREFLREIRTRRKSFRKPQYWKDDQSSDPVVIEPEDGKRYPTRKRRRASRFRGNDSCSSVNTDLGGWGDFIESSPSAFHIKKPTLYPGNTANKVAGSELPASIASISTRANGMNKDDLHLMMNKFAANEFSEQEYQEWLAKQRRMDELKSKRLEEEQSKEKSKDFWWMYGEKPDVGESNKSRMSDSVDQDSCMPCGFCKCCSAISNYVHIFGEVPENIQVYDIVEEVFEADEAASNDGC